MEEKIVPSHSAILSAYQNKSIHGNHMDMTKFTGRNDAGYDSVKGQIWIWVDELQTAPNAKPAQIDWVSSEIILISQAVLTI